MASSPTDLPVRHFAGADGLTMAYREMGEGRPVVLLHGLFSNGWTNWIRYGHALRIAEAGFRVIMPDLRGHGDSAAPHDPAAYPPDILAADGEALLQHLGLSDYDLGGYSLGARTVARMLVRGASPRRAILSGMGLEGLLATGQRSDHFRKILTGIGNHPQGSPEWMAAAFLKTTGGDPQAMLPLLDSFVSSSAAEIAGIATPTLVLSGVDDHDNGSAAALANSLMNGTLVEVPGNHMSAVLKPDLGKAIADFLVV
ncbi:alpha/beta fold hydrolase [Sphingomonas sp. MMS24-J13]|uniref:alpha/beta fold hydrolase n=1 Tax=Sphingomonas sp. MMS24-J13 TaxID=3238686 RepID=UPI00384C6B7C